MTTLPCTCRPAWSSAARRICSTGNLAATGTRRRTAEDIAASLIGIFTVAPPPAREARAGRLLNLLMDGLRPPARRPENSQSS